MGKKPLSPVAHDAASRHRDGAKRCRHPSLTGYEVRPDRSPIAHASHRTTSASSTTTSAATPRENSLPALWHARHSGNERPCFQGEVPVGKTLQPAHEPRGSTRRRASGLEGSTGHAVGRQGAITAAACRPKERWVDHRRDHVPVPTGTQGSPSLPMRARHPFPPGGPRGRPGARASWPFCCCSACLRGGYRGAQAQQHHQRHARAH